MVTSKVLKEIYISEDSDIYNEFSPIGKYSFLFDGYIFRGESSEKYKLLPSALREDKNSFYKLFNYADFDTSSNGFHFEHPQREFEYFYQNAELSAIKRFYNLADQKGLNLPDVPFLRKEILNPFPSFTVKRELGGIWIPDALLEIAALAQHYGVPTRLIDWTSNIYTSFYFASIGVIKDDNICNENMVLYALNYRMIEFLKNSTDKIPLRLFRPAHYKNPNSSYQKGILSCWSYDYFDMTDSIIVENDNVKFPLVDKRPLDELIQDYVNKHNISIENTFIYKFYIPHSKAYQIYDLVTKLGYGADSLFTGFDGVVKRIEEDITYHRNRKAK